MHWARKPYPGTASSSNSSDYCDTSDWKTAQVSPIAWPLPRNNRSCCPKHNSISIPTAIKCAMQAKWETNCAFIASPVIPYLLKKLHCPLRQSLRHITAPSLFTMWSDSCWSWSFVRFCKPLPLVLHLDEAYLTPAGTRSPGAKVRQIMCGASSAANPPTSASRSEIQMSSRERVGYLELSFPVMKAARWSHSLCTSPAVNAFSWGDKFCRHWSVSSQMSIIHFQQLQLNDSLHKYPYRQEHRYILLK